MVFGKLICLAGFLGRISPIFFREMLCIPTYLDHFFCELLLTKVILVQINVFKRIEGIIYFRGGGGI